MTPEELSDNLKTAARLLRMVGTAFGNTALLSGADAIDALAANTQLLTAIFAGVTTAYQFIEKLVGWLDKGGHNVAAAYLTAGA